MRIAPLFLALLVAAGSARGTPVTYAFSTVSNLAVFANQARPLRANPTVFTPGPNGSFSYDADTGVFSLSFQAALFASSAPIVDLSDSAQLDLVGSPTTLSIDFGVPAVTTPFVTDSGYTILVVGPLQLLLSGPSLFSDGVLRSGLLDPDFTDAAFTVATTYSPGVGSCVPENPGCPNPGSDTSPKTWAMIGLHQVPEPGALALLLVAALLAQTIRPARAS